MNRYTKSIYGPCGPIPSGSCRGLRPRRSVLFRPWNRLGGMDGITTDPRADTGYRPRQRVFTSLQVELIFRYLGRP